MGRLRKLDTNRMKYEKKCTIRYRNPIIKSVIEKKRIDMIDRLY